jgi:hypothetical protein
VTHIVDSTDSFMYLSWSCRAVNVQISGAKFLKFVFRFSHRMSRNSGNWIFFRGSYLNQNSATLKTGAESSSELSEETDCNTQCTNPEDHRRGPYNEASSTKLVNIFVPFVKHRIYHRAQSCDEVKEVSPRLLLRFVSTFCFRLFSSLQLWHLIIIFLSRFSNTTYYAYMIFLIQGTRTNLILLNSFTLMSAW